MTSKPKSKAGRPLNPRGKRVNFNLTIWPDQREKLIALGGSSWVQAQIDLAQVQTPKVTK